MLLWRVLIALVLQQGKSTDQLRPGLGRLDYFINKTTFGGDRKIGKLFLQLFDLGSSRRCLVSRFSDLAPIQYIDCSLSSHHRNLCRWPGKIYIGANVLRPHYAVRAAISFSRNHSNLGHCRLGKCVEEFRAVFDDATVFLRNAGQKAGHVFERDERNIEAVAETNKARAFDRAVDIENSGQKSRLVGYDAD